MKEEKMAENLLRWSGQRESCALGWGVWGRGSSVPSLMLGSSILPDESANLRDNTGGRMERGRIYEQQLRQADMGRHTI